MRATVSDENILATAKGGGFTAGGSFFEFASRFVIALLLARVLGARDYGLYVVSVSAATLFAGVSLLGLDDAMVRYVAILSGRRDRPGIWGTLQIGLGVSTFAGALLGAALFFVARPLAEGVFHEPRLTPLLHLLAIVVPFLTISNVLLGATRGFRRMDHAAFAENVVQSLVRVALLAAVALVGVLDLFSAAVIFGISDVAASVTFIALLNRHFPLQGSLRQESRRDVREILRFALPLWFSGLLRQFRRNLQTLMLGALSGVLGAGIFAIASNVNLVGHAFLLSLLVAVKPILAQLHDRGDREGLAELYTTATRWTFALYVPFFLTLLLYAEPLLAVFGRPFAAGAPALVVLAFAELANAGTGICGPMIDMTGHTRVKLLNSVLWTVLLIGGGAVLIPRWGVMGAAVATLIAVATVNLLCVVEVWVLERLIPFDRTFWKPLAAGAAALATGLALRSWFPVGSHPGPAALQATLVTTVYAGLIVAFGLAPQDRLVLGRAFKRAGSMIGRGQAVSRTAPGGPG